MFRKILAAAVATVVLMAAAPALAQPARHEAEAETWPVNQERHSFELGELDVVLEGGADSLGRKATPSISIVNPSIDARLLKGNTVKVVVEYTGIDVNTARFSACLSKLVKDASELNSSNIVYDFANGGAVFHAGPNRGEIAMDTNNVANGTYYLWVMFTDPASNTTGYHRIPINILSNTIFGWYSNSNGWYFIETDGSTVVTNGFRQIVHRGMMEYFYFNSNGYLATGWQNINGQDYCFNSEGVMQHDTWVERDGKRYYLNASGAVVQSGWEHIGGRRYYFTGGSVVTGLQAIDGVTYVFEDEGAIGNPGLVQSGGKTYYAETDGRVFVGWKDKRYFMPEMAIGIHTIDGKQYGFANDGTVCENGLYEMGDGVYYFVNSIMQTGYHVIDGKNMYFIESGNDAGKRAKGPVNVNGAYLFFNDSGERDEGSGERTVGGKMYYIVNGVPQVGEHNGRIYGSDFAALTGFHNSVFYEDGLKQSNKWVQFGGHQYLLDGEGRARTGWVNAGGWYYLHGDGRMAVNEWVKDGGWYYLKENGTMAVGWVKVENKWYYMNSSGTMATGWQKVGGAWYYMRGSGEMATGWVQDGSSWYYMKDSGAMATGWQQAGGKWYYLKGSGAMATGWQKVGGRWYYLAPGSGAMVTGTQTIGGKRYTFSSSGAMQ